MVEEWKTITTLPHIDQMTATYEASNLGRVRNARTKHIVKPHNHNSGYYSFNYRYFDDDKKEHYGCMLWHRVIATTWIPNPDNLPQIDHIDRDISNNCVSNLRWVSAFGNSRNVGPRSGIRYSRYNPTRIVNKHNEVVATFDTLEEACRVYKVSIPHALEMLHGRRRPKLWGTFQQDIFDNKK